MKRLTLMDLWERLETIIPVGEAAAYASALGKKSRGNHRRYALISHMELYRIYNTEAMTVLSRWTTPRPNALCAL
jgi:hypothetical protein